MILGQSHNNNIILETVLVLAILKVFSRTSLLKNAQEYKEYSEEFSLMSGFFR